MVFVIIFFSMPKEQGFSVPRAEEKDSPFIRILPGLFFPHYLNLLFALLSFSRLRSEAVCVCRIIGRFAWDLGPSHSRPLQ